MKKIITRFLTVALLTATMIAPATAAVLAEPSNAPSSATEPKDERIQSAMNEFKSLSKKEKREKVKEAKSVLNKYKADKKAGRAADSDVNQVLLVILAIFLPPLAVYLHQGEINNKFWISLVLSLLLLLPGIIYSLLVVLDVI